MGHLSIVRERRAVSEARCSSIGVRVGDIDRDAGILVGSAKTLWMTGDRFGLEVSIDRKYFFWKTTRVFTRVPLPEEAKRRRVRDAGRGETAS